MLERVFGIHLFQLVCDHQELAYTRQDPPWRVSTTQVSFRIIYENSHRVIEKSVWNHTLVNPFKYGNLFPTLNVVHNEKLVALCDTISIYWFALVDTISHFTDFHLSPGCFGTDIIQKCTKWSQIGVHGLKSGQIFAKFQCASFLTWRNVEKW